MPKFRKKPITIEAITTREALYGFTRDWLVLPKWLEDAYEAGGVVPTPTGIWLPTPEGSMLAGLDDWIIRGIEGEVYPCKREIFEATYEAVE